MTWDNAHLKNILASDSYTSSRGKTAHPSANTGALFNDLNQPLWKGKNLSFILLTRYSIKITIKILTRGSCVLEHPDFFYIKI